MSKNSFQNDREGRARSRPSPDLLRRERVRAPVRTELLDVGRVGDAEEAAPVRVDGIDVARLAVDLSAEDDLLAVR
jgi:hypothetical protein